MNNEASIEAVNISKVYWDGERRLEVFKNLSLKVKGGEIAAILGPSGSGKTTLLNVLSGLDRPDEGHVRIEGQDVQDLSEDQSASLRNKRIGFVFQFYHLLGELNATENVMLPAMIGGARVSEPVMRRRAMELLEGVGLGERVTHFPAELSGGEQQRVAIARALMNDPQILFCDEPTGNLDPATGRIVAQTLKDLCSRLKKTALLVTHDSEVARLADRVWDMTLQDWVEKKEKQWV